MFVFIHYIPGFIRLFLMHYYYIAWIVNKQQINNYRYVNRIDLLYDYIKEDIAASENVSRVGYATEFLFTGTITAVYYCRFFIKRVLPLLTKKKKTGKSGVLWHLMVGSLKRLCKKKKNVKLFKCLAGKLKHKTHLLFFFFIYIRTHIKTMNAEV